MLALVRPGRVVHHEVVRARSRRSSAARSTATRSSGSSSPEFKIAVVRPDRRRQGIGRALVDFADGIVRGKGRPEQLHGRRAGRAGRPRRSSRRPGSPTTRRSGTSTCRRIARSGRRSWPAGLVARPFDGTRDVEPWVRVFNAAFADHATPLQLDAAFIAAGLADPDTDDGDVILVEEAATGELVGFCATDPIAARRPRRRPRRDLGRRRPAGPAGSRDSGGSSSGPASSACGRSASRTSASRSTAGTRARWGCTNRRASSGAGRGTAGRDRWRRRRRPEP